MQSQHGKYVGDCTVITFCSNAKQPHCKLSNFFECCMEYNGEWFSSSEHAFQAQLVRAEQRKSLFGLGSDIGFLTGKAFESVGVKKGSGDAKAEHWGKKGMVGILAKMRINRIDKSQKLSMTKDDAERIFKEILLEKFKCKPELRNILLDTGDAYLLEFDRGAFRNNSEPPRWGGGVDKETKHVIGHNQMGALMMWVRDEMRRV